MRRPKISELEELPCPICGSYLERGAGRHGLVWFCRQCRAGAVTLPVLRQVAPRGFVNQLWQAALHDSRPSRRRCPACTQPFAELGRRSPAMPPQIKVCVRCFWVWFSSELLASFAAGPARTPELPRSALRLDGVKAETTSVDPERARRTLGALGAGVLLAALAEPSD